MSDKIQSVIQLGFMKLVVEDLDKMSAFYGAVCGLVEEGRAEAQIAGRPICEVYFKSDVPGTGTFTLTKFLDKVKPATEAVILGFIASDIDQFVKRSVAVGGTVVEAPSSMPEHGVKAAFVKDIEGNLIEVVELLQA